MNFILDRMKIKAGAAIADGDYAAYTNKFNFLSNDTRSLKEILGRLVKVQKDLEAYYEKHRFLGRIVKFFDHNKIGGHFGKKLVVDSLIKALGQKILKLDAMPKDVKMTLKVSSALRAD